MPLLSDKCMYKKTHIDKYMHIGTALIRFMHDQRGSDSGKAR